MIMVFVELRKVCSARRIDIRGALDEAVKNVIAPTCTGDALVQQLAKREKHLLELWKSQGTPMGRANKKKEEEATAAVTGEEDDGPTYKESTVQSSQRTSRKPTNARNANSLDNGANHAGARGISTPVRTDSETDEEDNIETLIKKAAARPLRRASVKKGIQNAQPGTARKTLPKTENVVTLSLADYDSDSDYTESPDKGKKKRARGNVKKASQKAKKSLIETAGKEEARDEVAKDAQLHIQDPAEITIPKSSAQTQLFFEDSSAYKCFGGTPISSDGIGEVSTNNFLFKDDFGGPLFGGTSFDQTQFNPSNMPIPSLDMDSVLPPNGMGNYRALEM
jgi:hypothetical protein